MWKRAESICECWPWSGTRRSEPGLRKIQCLAVFRTQHLAGLQSLQRVRRHSRTPGNKDPVAGPGAGAGQCPTLLDQTERRDRDVQWTGCNVPARQHDARLPGQPGHSGGKPVNPLVVEPRQ